MQSHFPHIVINFMIYLKFFWVVSSSLKVLSQHPNGDSVNVYWNGKAALSYFGYLYSILCRHTLLYCPCTGMLGFLWLISIFYLWLHSGTSLTFLCLPLPFSHLDLAWKISVIGSAKSLLAFHPIDLRRLTCLRTSLSSQFRLNSLHFYQRLHLSLGSQCIRGLITCCIMSKG